MTNQLEQVCKLLEISRGDIGRLEHIKYTLQKGKSLYNSDEKYLQELSIKYLIKNAIQNEDIKEDNTKKLKNTCYVCDKEIYGSDRFVCPYCDGLFCNEHRIPENHQCVGLHNASAPRRNEGYISHHKPIIAETSDNLEIYPTIKKRKFKGEKNTNIGKIVICCMVVMLVMFVVYVAVSNDISIESVKPVKIIDNEIIINLVSNDISIESVKPEPTPDVEEDVVIDAVEKYTLFPIKYYVTDSADQYHDDIYNAFNSWKKLNPNFDFYEIESPANFSLKITSQKHIDGDMMGYYETSETHIIIIISKNSEIVFELGDFDCNGNFIMYDDMSIQKTIEHEIGHHLGLEHVLDETHLMYGDDGTIASLYDDLGYNIPNKSEFWFLGQKELSMKIDKWQKGGAHQLSDMIDVFNCYPNVESSTFYTKPILDWR